MEPSRRVATEDQFCERSEVEMYEPPMIVSLGSLEELTKGSSGTIGDGGTKRSKP
jgi:hypothetical protein